MEDKRKYIIDYIDGAVLSYTQCTDSGKYAVMRENLEGAVDQLIGDGIISSNP